MDDLIDFPCSDLWRDHYAAQGLTYPSGQQAHRKASVRPSDEGKPAGGIGQLVRLVCEQEAKIHALTQVIRALKTQLNQHEEPVAFEGPDAA